MTLYFCALCEREIEKETDCFHMQKIGKKPKKVCVDCARFISAMYSAQFPL